MSHCPQGEPSPPLTLLRKHMRRGRRSVGRAGSSASPGGSAAALPSLSGLSAHARSPQPPLAALPPRALPGRPCGRPAGASPGASPGCGGRRSARGRRQARRPQLCSSMDAMAALGGRPGGSGPAPVPPPGPRRSPHAQQRPAFTRHRPAAPGTPGAVVRERTVRTAGMASPRGGRGSGSSSSPQPPEGCGGMCGEQWGLSLLVLFSMTVARSQPSVPAAPGRPQAVPAASRSRPERHT